MLTANDLALMRAAQQAALPDTCSIQRATSSHNVIGEGVPSWAAVGVAIPCRLAPQLRRRDLQAVGEQQRTVGDWVVTLPYDTDVRSGDRIIIGGDVYDVIDTQRAESWLTAIRCEVRRVGDG
jgi:hypothetical protein